MQIEVKREVRKVVEETITLNLVSYWLVRIVRDNDFPCPKEVIDEYEFDHDPDEQEIGNCLAAHNHRGSKVFASVVKNYRFDEREEQNNEQ